ncbi:MAG: glucokinase [Alphaproteobacteria bacterium]|nr:glucokinase [Alphaproteobacteria bacterium]
MAPTDGFDGPVLIADIGGTNIRFAVLVPGETLGTIGALRGDDFETFEDLVEEMWHGTPPDGRARAAMLAVACPPEPEEIRFTNRDWRFSKSALQARFGLEKLVVVNDFAAVALALPHLTDADTSRLGGGGTAQDGAAMAVLGPGTGLGVAGLLPHGQRWVVVAGEGGHTTLAAQTPEEGEILAGLARRHGHVSAERALSGPGLAALHDVIREIGGLPPRPLTAADLVEIATRDEDPAALQVIGHFADFLGTVASDTALTFGATGGVFLAGGVLPRIGALFPAARFRARFETKGRFSDYCAQIPTRLITHPNVALVGLAGALPEVMRDV